MGSLRHRRGRSPGAAQAPGEAAASRSSARRAGALLVFAVALVLRLAFWLATPDRAWPGSASYAGDTATWVAHAEAPVSSRSVRRIQRSVRTPSFSKVVGRPPGQRRAP